jgi:hypothetical protein
MKKLLVLLMVLLSVCSAAFAESLEDVLKDCKLDRNRWKVVEWFKAEKFVRLYDSQTVTVTGPGQFDAVIMDYYYDGDCGKDSCNLRKNRHYHSEKWGFDTTKATGTLRSFDTRDIDGNVVDSYDYSAKMQISSPVKRKSIEDRTMQKIKEPLKSNKDFAAIPKTNTPDATKKTEQRLKIKGLVPMPMAIGASDGEWTYLGRYISQRSFQTFNEFENQLVFYNGSAEADGLYDVYYHHEHYGNGEGRGCLAFNTGDGYRFQSEYGCVLKIVILNRNGMRVDESGIKYGTMLLSMGGYSRPGKYSLIVQRVRIFDNVTHQLLAESSDYKKLNGEQRSYEEAKNFRVGPNSPFSKAMEMSNCPLQPYDINLGYG